MEIKCSVTSRYSVKKNLKKKSLKKLMDLEFEYDGHRYWSIIIVCLSDPDQLYFQLNFS